MVQITIGGIDINFPYTPYKVQEDYMSKVIECLQKGVNGMLESPTGTGKTLSLLCSALAWLENQKAHHQLLQLQHTQSSSANNMFDDLGSQIKNLVGVWNSQSSSMLPKIIYSSRTHSQLSQAIQELKRSSYKHVKSVVLGSRDQLCLHPEVSKIQNHSAKVYACRAKINSKTCIYHLNVDEKMLSQTDYMETPVMDIEDLIILGKKHKCCPYYAARNLKSKSDIVFTPYNYIIDPKTRRSQGIELENNIVIFDEAHNIESACEESMSFQLKSLDLAMCINEVTHTIQLVKDFENKDFSSSENDGSVPDFTLSDLSILKVMFCELEEMLDKEVALCPSIGSPKPGNYMIEVLEKIELTQNKRDIVLDLLDKIILFQSTTAVSPWASKGAGLQKFSDILKIQFSRTSDVSRSFNMNEEYLKKYRMYLQYDTSNKPQTSADFWSTSSANERKKWKLDCWCFSPGIGMQDVISQGVHSVLLTSGTLSPLPPLIYELGVDFPVQIESPHIIKKNQVFVAVVTHGPDGTQLNSSYQNRFNEKYISSLGRSISNFCRIIPDGVLVFFPSYSVMRGNISKWEETGVWHSISAIKPTFAEPQSKDAFQESLEQFYSHINDPKSKGATLLGVCRGKVSEGLDFADSNSRAVIITGLPFPPSMDPRVKMKMAYLNDAAKMNKGLVGTDWYVLQASRAINQAIGRVIRHKDDFGAILLCDNRFSEKRIQSQLSKWVQGKIQVFNSFGPAMKQLCMFFKELNKNPPLKSCPAESRCDSQLKITGHAQSSLGGFTINPSLVVRKKDIENGLDSFNSSKKSNDENIIQSYLKSSDPLKQAQKVSDTQKSIFDAIEEFAPSTSIASSSGTNSVFSGISSSVASGSCHIRPSEPNNDTRDTKRRKINIALRQAIPNTEATSSDSAIDSKTAEKEMWKKYIKEVKNLLGGGQLYNKFCTSVKDFRTSKDTLAFACDMKEIFQKFSEKDTFLQKTSLIVNPKDRTRFLLLCAD